MVQYLPRPRGTSTKTETVTRAQFGDKLVRLYTIRIGKIAAHSYAKGGAEGQLSPTVFGYGVSVESTLDGIQDSDEQVKTQAQAVTLFDAVKARYSNQEGK